MLSQEFDIDERRVIVNSKTFSDTNLFFKSIYRFIIEIDEARQTKVKCALD